MAGTYTVRGWVQIPVTGGKARVLLIESDDNIADKSQTLMEDALEAFDQKYKGSVALANYYDLEAQPPTTLYFYTTGLDFGDGWLSAIDSTFVNQLNLTRFIETLREFQYLGTSTSKYQMCGMALVKFADHWTWGSIQGLYEVEGETPSMMPHPGKLGFFVSNEPMSRIITSSWYNTNFDDYMNRLNPMPEDDPYGPGDDSDEGGGEGDFDTSSDIIPIPDLPSLSAVDTGLITLFNPSISQLKSLSQYLWTDLMQDIASGGSLETVIEDLKKIVSNPYDAILGLSIVPVNITTAGSKDIKMYGVLDSGISAPYAASQYAAVDCGTLHVNEFWGAYLDYAPYTKITSLYLPYIGVVSVDVDEIMGKALRIVYHVDILSGQCIAYIIINGSVEYQYQGHCSCSVPITAVDFSSTITSGLSLIGNISNIASSAIGGFGMGGGVGAALGAARSAVSNAPSIAGNVMNMKPDIKAGSGIGSMGGQMSVQKPFLIAIRPRQSKPTRQNSFTGYPSNITMAVRQCSGYTEFDYINLDGIALTGEEKDELLSILQEGVYL